MNQYSKEYRLRVLDEDILEAKEEQNKWLTVEASLAVSIEAQEQLILTFQGLIEKLQALIDALGGILGPIFVASLEAQIKTAQDAISSLEANIVEAKTQQDKARENYDGLQYFVDELETLKKKDVDDGLIFVFVNEIGEEITSMQINLDKNGFAKIDSITDKAGNPAKVDGAPQWKTEGDDIAVLTPSEDGFTCKVDSNGKLGLAKLYVECDADLGEGVKLLRSNDLEIEAASGEASQVTISEVVA